MPERGMDVPERANPSIVALLRPKWITMRARADANRRGHRFRIFFLAMLGTAFCGFAFVEMYKLLAHFRSVPDVGTLLAGKLLGLVLAGFFSILLLSNIITSLSSFFLSKDLDLLNAAPVSKRTFYAAKFIETIVLSSWMIVLLAAPVLAAYGVVYHGGPFFPLVVLALLAPFFIIPAAVGSTVTLLLVNVFPARRARDVLGVIALLASGGMAILFRMARPERFIQPDGTRVLGDLIAVVHAPTSPLLPSSWVQRAIMSWLGMRTDLLPYAVLWVSAVTLLAIGALLHRALYDRTFSQSQESGSRTARAGSFTRRAYALLSPLGIVRRELVLKEVRVFFRDSTQWSQLILLAVLVMVYVFNIKFLPLRGEGMTVFLVNVIPFLNLVLAGFVLASIAARFIFPGISLEGRTLWLLRSSPLEMRQLLWSKFWVGTLPLLILAVLTVGITDYLLQVTAFMMMVSILSITFLTLAISGLAIGFGTVFPQFETENAAQIPTSLGGVVFLMSSIALIGAVVMLEARPVYAYLGAQAFGTPIEPWDMVVGFGLAAMLCCATTLLPIEVALRRLEIMQR